MIPRNLVITILLLVLAVAGMGLYGLHLRRQALDLQQRSDTRPVAPPATGPAEKVTIFVPDDEHGTLVRREVSANLPSEPSLKARELVRLIIVACQEKTSKHPLASAAEAKEVFLLNNNRTAVVDVNAAFADQHRSGVLVEELTLASLARTLGANLNGTSEMKLIVDGHERDTLAGHADLTETYSTNLDWHVE